jgi:hypothetical protein
MCHLDMWDLCGRSGVLLCVASHARRCTQFVWMWACGRRRHRAPHHDLSTGCFLGGYSNGLGGLSTHEIGWKKLAICSGPPVRPQKKHVFRPHRPFSITRAPMGVATAAVASSPLVIPRAWIQRCLWLVVCVSGSLRFYSRQTRS